MHVGDIFSQRLCDTTYILFPPIVKALYMKIDKIHIMNECKMAD